MKESGFWRKLRPLMKEAAPGIVVERIESWSTPGFPDVSGTWKGRDFWLELKIVRNGRVEMRPGQVRWLRSRWMAGSRCYVLAYCEVTRELILIEGYEADMISKKHDLVELCRSILSLDISGVSQLMDIVHDH